MTGDILSLSAVNLTYSANFGLYEILPSSTVTLAASFTYPGVGMNSRNRPSIS